MTFSRQKCPTSRRGCRTLWGGYELTGRDLKANRIKLEGDGHKSVKRIAEKLETPKRTYQDWEAKPGSIPGVAAVAVKLLVKQHDNNTA